MSGGGAAGLAWVRAGGAGADRDVAPILEGKTGALLEAAFAFPVAVHVPPATAAAGPLAVDVELRYVPTAGTLALSADVTQPGSDTVPIRCAVHYVKTAGGYRYLVRAPGAPLAGPAPLAARVDDSWAWARTPGDDRVVLRVHVGAGWRPVPDELRAAAARGPARAARGEVGAVSYAPGPLRMAGVRRRPGARSSTAKVERGSGSWPQREQRISDRPERGRGGHRRSHPAPQFPDVKRALPCPGRAGRSCATERIHLRSVYIFGTTSPRPSPPGGPPLFPRRTMADSFQKEKPPARVNLFLELPDGDATEKVELPFRTLVLGDFTGRADDTPLEDREVVDVNADNFESVMKSMDLGLDMVVPDTVRGGDNDVRVNLSIEGMDDFRPESVARQIPEVDRLVAVRNLLQDLRNRVVSMSSFRRQLEAIVTDPAQLDRLVSELGALVEDDADSDDA